MWNAGGIRPQVCEVLQQIVDAAGSRALVWRGSDLPTAEQGIKVLGTLLGHEDFVAAHFRFVLESRPVGTDTVGAGRLVCMDFVASQRRGL